MKRLAVLATPACFVALFVAAAAAHPDHGGGNREMFPGEGVVVDDQHGPSSGHLPAVNRNVRVVGRAVVTNPSGLEGRIADVAAHGNYAFLTAFRDPVCTRTGAHVIDISDPAHPAEIPSAFIPTAEGNYAGEGAQTLELDNALFQGVVFLHQNETCPGAPAPTAPRTRGGINIWDVTDARRPVPLALHAGDYANPDGSTDTQANQTHSMFAWSNKFDDRTYVVLVDDEETTDVDIMDITDPRNPVLINELDLDEPPFDVDQPSPANLTSSFSHDMVVTRVGKRYVMNMGYWDGGYVLLDVTNPRPGGVTLIAETDYAALDEERLARGHSISPEGNAHQSEIAPNNRFLIGTDEDFNPYRVVATITSGPYAGTEYTATSASATPPVDETTTVSGTPTYVGEACGAVPPGTGIALAVRGTCGFQAKLDNIKAAGYSSGIVMNAVRPDCLGRVTMAATGTIPFVFVDRLTGLKLLQVPGVTTANACTTANPPGGTAAASTKIEAIFDGWGYIRLYGLELTGEPGSTGAITQIDTFTVPEAQDPAYARGFGALSVHEVAIDPHKGHKLVYVSYYSAGFRVLTYGKEGLEEVGAFIDEGGSDFWGVEVHTIGKRQYVLASDRDSGLYILEYTGKKR